MATFFGPVCIRLFFGTVQSPSHPYHIGSEPDTSPWAQDRFLRSEKIHCPLMRAPSLSALSAHVSVLVEQVHARPAG